MESASKTSLDKTSNFASPERQARTNLKSQTELKSNIDSNSKPVSIAIEKSKPVKPTDMTIPLLQNASLDRFQETSTSTNL